LNGFFADPDTEQAVRFATTQGDFDMALYATATPQTVSNFLNYVHRGAYSNSIVHRSMPDFIVQGGGFRPEPPDFIEIPTDPSPTNEPGVQNLRGTVALAKVGGNPDSATCQWFINLADNSENLDNQNGGFTAFGRVGGGGLAVAEAINALPRGSYTVTVDGQNVSFTDWPMNTPPPAPATMDQSKLVLVLSVNQIEPLRYALAGESVTGLVTAVVQGSNLLLAPLSQFGGVTTLSLAAIDLDGNSVTQAVEVEVSTPYSAWLNQNTLEGTNSTPQADPDRDAVVNGVEFALGGSPTVPDRAGTMPKGALVQVSGEAYAALTFRLRKDLGGATVVMWAADTLPDPWAQVWTSQDLAGPQVLERLDQGDYWLVTVREPAPLLSAAPTRFLRLTVAIP
jgi:cyclophilin family peptidyl-prolyl cis-trans isomerase